MSECFIVIVTGEYDYSAIGLIKLKEQLNIEMKLMV